MEGGAARGGRNFPSDRRFSMIMLIVMTTVFHERVNIREFLGSVKQFFFLFKFSE